MDHTNFLRWIPVRICDIKLLPSAQFMEEISEYFQQHEQGLAAQELFRNQLTNLYETILYYIWVTCLLVEVQNFLLYVPIKVEQICAVIETIVLLVIQA